MASSHPPAICRVCHGGEEIADLFHPCKCSGSIGFIHQHCLQSWLKYSKNRSVCEICSEQFNFQRLYREGTPTALSLLEVIRGVGFKGISLLRSASRIAFVAFCWIICLPLLINFCWTFMFSSYQHPTDTIESPFLRWNFDLFFGQVLCIVSVLLVFGVFYFHDYLKVLTEERQIERQMAMNGDAVANPPQPNPVAPPNPESHNDVLHPNLTDPPDPAGDVVGTASTELPQSEQEPPHQVPHPKSSVSSDDSIPRSDYWSEHHDVGNNLENVSQEMGFGGSHSDPQTRQFDEKSGTHEFNDIQPDPFSSITGSDGSSDISDIDMTQQVDQGEDLENEPDPPVVNEINPNPDEPREMNLKLFLGLEGPWYLIFESLFVGAFGVSLFLVLIFYFPHLVGWTIRQQFSLVFDVFYPSAPSPEVHWFEMLFTGSIGHISFLIGTVTLLDWEPLLPHFLGQWRSICDSDAYRIMMRGMKFYVLLSKVIFMLIMYFIVAGFVYGVMIDFWSAGAFENAQSVADRIVEAPILFSLSMWVQGTIYLSVFFMFTVQLRRALRPGMLWFLNDPNNPNFHPFKDIVEHPLPKQFGRVLKNYVMHFLLLSVVAGIACNLVYFTSLYPLRENGSISGFRFSLQTVVVILILNGGIPLIEIIHPQHLVYKTFKAYFKGVGWLFSLDKYLLPPDPQRSEHDDNEWHAVRERANMAAQERNAPVEAGINVDGAENIVNDGGPEVPQTATPPPSTTSDVSAEANKPDHFRLRMAGFLLVFFICVAIAATFLFITPLQIGRGVMELVKNSAQYNIRFTKTEGGIFLDPLNEIAEDGLEPKITFDIAEMVETFPDVYVYFLGLIILGFSGRVVFLTLHWCLSVALNCHGSWLTLDRIRQGAQYLLSRTIQKYSKVWPALVIVPLTIMLVPLILGALIDLCFIMPFLLPLDMDRSPHFTLRGSWITGLFMSKLIIGMSYLFLDERNVLRSSIEGIYRQGIYDFKEYYRIMATPLNQMGMWLATPYAISRGLVPWLGLSLRVQAYTFRYGFVVAGILVHVPVFVHLIRLRFKKIHDELKDDLYCTGMVLQNNTEVDNPVFGESSTQDSS